MAVLYEGMHTAKTKDKGVREMNQVTFVRINHSVDIEATMIIQSTNVSERINHFTNPIENPVEIRLEPQVFDAIARGLNNEG